jgi:peptidoglycan hydrolase-like protein with peptidoglycan-binding domain
MYAPESRPGAKGGDMEITESALTAQYQRASSAWPFIHQAELARGLPRMLLFAVGSRETNLTNEVGDFGHGHGVWQLDDRSHTPPGGFARFDVNVPLQSAIAATMLQGMLAITGGNVEEAAAIYNSGQRGEFGTTHHDYGIDVRQRMQFLQQKLGNGGRVQSGIPAWFHRELSLASPLMKGADVTVVQKKTGAASDGVFGLVTQAHVVNFQSHHDLTADGIVGPQTARVLGP